MGFIVHKVSDDNRLRTVYRLRYKVYCEEWGFERPEEYPDGLETDIFDKQSVHFLAENDTGRLVGTIRLILSSPEGFPLEKYCELNINKNELPRESLAEISRLAISKEFRRRAEDRYLYGPGEEGRGIGSFNYSHGKFRRRSGDGYKSGKPFHERRIKHEAVASLYKAIYLESKRRQITHWYAVMTKGLYMLLSRLGIDFHAIGEAVDYHGIRTPYVGEIKKIEQSVSIKNPELFKEFSREL